MFIGHFAVAFAAKRAAPRTSLGVLVGAAQLLDLIWPPLVLAGIEQVRVEPGNTAYTPLNFVSYPYSHSLLMSAMWALLAAAVYWVVARTSRGGVVVGLAVFSHWLLDYLTHRPDLPLYPGSAVNAGLSLWNSVPATVIVESLMFVAGVCLYARGTRSLDRIGTAGFWGFVAFLVLVDVLNITGPPPPSASAVAGTALAMVLLVAWAWWFDRHRKAVQ